MTVEDAIKWLKSLEQRYGPSVEVYFDCPTCKQAWTPTTVATQAVHLTGVKP